MPGHDTVPGHAFAQELPGHTSAVQLFEVTTHPAHSGGGRLGTYHATEIELLAAGVICFWEEGQRSIDNGTPRVVIRVNYWQLMFFVSRRSEVNR